MLPRAGFSFERKAIDQGEYIAPIVALFLQVKPKLLMQFALDTIQRVVYGTLICWSILCRVVCIILTQMNVLFVCSRNKWRSRTAEIIFKNKHGFQVQSAGTAPSARIKVTEKMVNWAEVIFVMEKKHKQRLAQKFPEIIAETEIIILDIPDDYQYMDPELIEVLEVSVMEHFEDEA